MEFTPQQINDIERLAGAGYTIHKVAMYLDVPPRDLLAEYANEESVFRYHYDRGVVLSEAAVALKLQESAEKGNITAIQQMDAIRLEQRKRNLRIKIFGRDF